METPKEETILKCDLCKTYPRLEGTNKCESCYSVVRNFLEQDPRFKDTLLPDVRKLKQETLEEAAERLTKDFPHYSVRGNMDDSEIKGWFLEALQKGAKWQQERSYSQNDMWEAYKASNTIFEDEIALRQEFEEWFEQFKKK